MNAQISLIWVSSIIHFHSENEEEPTKNLVKFHRQISFFIHHTHIHKMATPSMQAIVISIGLQIIISIAGQQQNELFSVSVSFFQLLELLSITTITFYFPFNLSFCFFFVFGKEIFHNVREQRKKMCIMKFRWFT